MYSFIQRKKLPLLILPLLFPLVLVAQDEIVEDPFNKPAVWQKVRETPNSKSLWVQYFGKPWIALSVDDRDNISIWRKQLNREIYKKELQGDSQLLASKSGGLWKEALSNHTSNKEMLEKLEVEKSQFHRMLIQHIVPESQLLLELKQNVEANFILIEDVFKAEFGELGESYVRYESEHPEGSYSKILWVDKQTERLNKLKTEYISELKDKAVH